MNWLNKSSNIIRSACTPWGIKASLTAQENYGAIFTRDAVMAGIAGILLEDAVIIEGLKNTLDSLRELQGSQGQIPSNFRVEDQQITKVSFGTLSPKIDSCTWYLIGVGLMAKSGYIEKEDFEESVTKTINLLEGIEYNNKHLMYIPKGGNWADEYIYEGYILYDQILRLWGLDLLSTVYKQQAWKRKAKDINTTIIQSYKDDASKFYNASFYPGGTFKKFDLAAHSIAGICLTADDDFISNSLNWIGETFLAKHQLPTAFHPVIDQNSAEWDTLSKYFLFRFKNMPHHFHNGGIWWIWLGWLSVSLSLWEKDKTLKQLTQLAFDFLDQHADVFDFDEYIAADTLQVGGTKALVYTATGIIFLQLAQEGYDFSTLKPGNTNAIKEPLTIRKEYFNLSKSIVTALNKASLLDNEKLVINIAGESGSGKSVTAKCLQLELAKAGISAVILHQDGYYKLKPSENHQKRKEDISWVGLNELKLDLMQKHIDLFKSGATTLDVPTVNYIKDSFSVEPLTVSDQSVLIIEGVYTFSLKNTDYSIFMSRTYKETLEKRKLRTREAYDPFVEQVLDIEHQIVSKQQHLADATISKEYQLL